MKPSTPKAKPSPSTQLRKIVFGGSLKKTRRALQLFTLGLAGSVAVLTGSAQVTEEDHFANFPEGSTGYQSAIAPSVLNFLAYPDTTLTLSGAAPPNPGTGYSEGTSRSWSTLVDGSFGLVPQGGAGGPGEVYIHNDYILTYTFAASHIITNIDVFSGWGDNGRINQAYTVSYATAAAPNTFIDLATVAYQVVDPPDYGNSTWVRLTLTNVVPVTAKAIRFTFGLVQNDGVGFTELVVQGPTPPQPYIYTFGLPGIPAVISGTNIAWTVPFGIDVTMLAPTFELSPGATANIASGSTRNFSSPVHYIVTSSEGVKDYLVTVTVSLTFPPLEENHAAYFPANSTGYQANIASTNLNLLARPDTTLALSGLAPADPIGGDNTSTNWSTLVDGSYGLVPVSAGGPGEVLIHDDYILTYTFAASHNIFTIDSFTGWSDSGRTEQDYTVSYATEAAPNTFIPLATVFYHPGDWNSTWVRLTPVVTVNAKAIRFTFGAQQNGGVGYTELVVQEPPPTLTITSITGPVAGNFTLTGTSDKSATVAVFKSTNVALPRTDPGWAQVGVPQTGTSFNFTVPQGSGTQAFFILKVP